MTDQVAGHTHGTDPAHLYTTDGTWLFGLVAVTHSVKHPLCGRDSKEKQGGERD